MTLPVPPPDPDDELASAYLDGEATPAERARVEGDPGLRARTAAFAALRQALAAAPLPGDATARDRAVAAALADGSAASPRRRRLGVAVVGAVAAAVILLVVVVAATRSGNSNGPTAAQLSPSTTAAAPAAARAGSATTAAAGATTIAGPGGSVAAASGATSLAPAGVPFLGAVGDAAGVRTLVETRSGVATTVAGSTPTMPAVACSMASARLMGAVTWDGVGAFLYVTDDSRAVIVRIDGCATLAVVPLG